MIDPEAAAVLADWESRSPIAVELLPVADARASGLVDIRTTGPGLEVPHIQDLDLVSGGITVGCRVYRRDHQERPLIVYAHGGGWTLLSVDSSDVICRELAARTPFNVVSVDYRLAPEAPYPAALDDVWAACEAVAAGMLGYVPQAILVAGDSAGGNLAAAACLRGRRLAPQLLTGQVLLYPALGRDFTTESYRDFGDGFRLTKSAMSWFWDNYAGDEWDDEECLPLRATTMRGLPPAIVVTAGLDPLRDDGRRFAARLVADGVDVQYMEFSTLPHGLFMMLGAVAEARRAMDALCQMLSVWGSNVRA